MNILVTGGLGYIGSHLVKALLEDDPYNNILVLDKNVIEGQLAANAIKDDRVEYLGVDLSDSSQMVGIDVSETDTVFHLAAYSCVRDSDASPSEYYQNNVVATANLIKLFKSESVRINEVNMIFASSSTVYGNNHSRNALLETTPTGPINVYGRTKLMCERMLNDSGDIFNKVVSLRYCNVIGSHPDGVIGEFNGFEKNRIVPTLIYNSGSGATTDINGDSHLSKRDYINVNDLVTMHIALIRGIEKASNVYCLGSGELTPLDSVITTTRDALQYPLFLQYTEQQSCEVKLGAYAHTMLFESHFGKKPNTELKDSIKQMVKYYDMNRKILDRTITLRS